MNLSFIYHVAFDSWITTFPCFLFPSKCLQYIACMIDGERKQTPGFAFAKKISHWSIWREATGTFIIWRQTSAWWSKCTLTDRLSSPNMVREWIDSLGRNFIQWVCAILKERCCILNKSIFHKCVYLLKHSDCVI